MANACVKRVIRDPIVLLWTSVTIHVKMDAVLSVVLKVLEVDVGWVNVFVILVFKDRIVQRC